MKASLKISSRSSRTPLDLATAEMVATVVEAEDPRPAPIGIWQLASTWTPRSPVPKWSSVALAARATALEALDSPRSRIPYRRRRLDEAECQRLLRFGRSERAALLS